MHIDIVTGDERVELYNEVWEEPVTVVAKRYGMSDVALRVIGSCKITHGGSPWWQMKIHPRF